MKKALVIDASEKNLAIYAKTLQGIPELAVTTFTSSTVGLHWAAQNEPDIVVIDYDTPQLNGIEFMVAFRKRPRTADVPVIMITDPKDRTIRHSALQNGADDFLERPADEFEFLVRARNLLKLRDRTITLASKAARLADEVRKATEVISRRELETIHRLTRAAEYRDKETHNHIVRMGHYSQLLSKAIGQSDDRQALMGRAAPMHDIGKVAIPDRILLKPGKLTSIEWQVMQSHARAGYDILAESDSPLMQLGAEIALAHHEKFDGTGYPQKLKGKDIPLSGRIVAIADVFDALLSNRPYKPAWRLPDVLETLKRGKGNHFDPDLVDAFLQITPELQKVREEFSDSEAAA
ncbi:MAG: HD domain-containing protein [Candidatus Eremiobacteraeota bacterium]|nr:HD domain-containing protein [Candidatus Eremiobacteraeota bacterium]